MKKLRHLKNWQSLDEAAAWLTAEMDELVTSRDIIQHVLEGELQLSCFLLNANAKPERGHPIKLNDGPYKLVLDSDITEFLWRTMRDPKQTTVVLDGYFITYRDGSRLEVQDFSPVKEGKYYPVLGFDSETRITYTKQGEYSPTQTLRVETLGVLREDLLAFEERTRSTLRNVPQWPWGTHETRLLREMAAAAKQWWTTYDPDDPTTAPTSKEVCEWLELREVSKRVAEAIAQILRADDLRMGPRKLRK